jgi:hypothetical protein
MSMRSAFKDLRMKHYIYVLGLHVSKTKHKFLPEPKSHVKPNLN